MSFEDTVNASSSSSVSDPATCRAFISFRSSDIHENTTDNLFAALIQNGMSPFRDVEKYEQGIYIPSELFMAIEASKIFIVIFSEWYASTSWCLDELATIVECMEKKNSKVLTIFHHVNPSDVRDQTGVLADAFAKHEERFKDSIEKVNLWRLALRKAASIPGKVLNYGDPESQLINELIGSLCNLSNQMPEDGSTNWDLPPIYDEYIDDAVDVMQEAHVVPDDVADVLQEAHVVPDDVANVPQEAHVVEDHVANSQWLCPVCDNAIGVAFCCGHLFCVECGDRYSTCPVCRDRVHIRFRVFLPR